MSIPYIVGEVLSFITGTNGKIAEVTNDNRLQVTTKASEIPSEGIAHFDKTLKYSDMNALTGGITRKTKILQSDPLPTTVFKYTGKGLFVGFMVTLEDLDKDWLVYLKVDGVDIFENGISTKDLDKSSIYNLDTTKDVFNPWMGVDVQKDTLRYHVPFDKPIIYNTDVEILVKPINSDLKFKAGLAVLSKEL